MSPSSQRQTPCRPSNITHRSFGRNKACIFLLRSNNALVALAVILVAADLLVLPLLLVHESLELRVAESKNTADTQVKVRLVSPPLYVLTSQTLDKAIGIEVLEQAIKDIDSSIRAAGGMCTVKMAPKAVTENDDAELQALMDKKERENQEVSGDEDDSESDEGVVAAQ